MSWYHISQMLLHQANSRCFSVSLHPLSLFVRNRSLLVCVPLEWILNRTISVIPGKYAWAYAWLSAQTHRLLTLCSHSTSNTSWLKPPTWWPPLVCKEGTPPSCGKRRGELQRAQGYPRHRRKPATVRSRKKGKTGESRTPDSRERTETRMVIREGGGIGWESYTLTSPSKTENRTACFE